MGNQNAKEYLKTQIKTAPPEKLVILLYDGAIRFCEQAKVQLDNKDYEQSCNLIIRAQRIISELLCSLKPEKDQEVADNLMRLYQFIFVNLMKASVERSKDKLDEVIQILRPLREAWNQAICSMHKEKSDGIINRAELAKVMPGGEPDVVHIEKEV